VDSIEGRLAVKGFFDGFGGPFSAADFDFELGARGGEGWWEVPIAEESTIESTKKALANYKDQKKRQRNYL